jgi:hypothetical protein
MSWREVRVATSQASVTLVRSSIVPSLSSNLDLRLKMNEDEFVAG